MGVTVCSSDNDAMGVETEIGPIVLLISLVLLCVASRASMSSALLSTHACARMADHLGRGSIVTCAQFLCGYLRVLKYHVGGSV